MEEQTLIVPDVTQFRGHIFCSSASLSEIVIHIIRDHKVLGVLDVDSSDLSTFDTTDQKYLEEVIGWLEMGEEN